MDGGRGLRLLKGQSVSLDPRIVESVHPVVFPSPMVRGGYLKRPSYLSVLDFWGTTSSRPSSWEERLPGGVNIPYLKKKVLRRLSYVSVVAQKGQPVLDPQLVESVKPVVSPARFLVGILRQIPYPNSDHSWQLTMGQFSSNPGYLYFRQK